MYYSEQQCNQLYDSYDKIEEQGLMICESYFSIVFSNQDIAEYITHGFMRRLKILTRCIHNIYKICPPDFTTPPTTEERHDLEINLQAFMFNVFGCLDNLARIWVKEKAIKKDGKDPKDAEIGLIGKKYKYIRKSFSEDFQKYLNDTNSWFEYIENYRHALAHKIPLYVVPLTVTPAQNEQRARLDILRQEAVKRRDFSEFDRLSEEIETVGKFEPLMTHSFGNNSKVVRFHPQILADWGAIIEISQKFLQELASKK